MLDGLGATAGGDDRVAGGQSGLGDVHAHSTAGAGDKPNLLVNPVLHDTPPSSRLGRRGTLPTSKHDATYPSPAHRKKGYSPKCLEGRFSEVRLYRVLGSSAKGCGAS